MQIKFQSVRAEPFDLAQDRLVEALWFRSVRFDELNVTEGNPRGTNELIRSFLQ
jgi:hypothetical protein